MAVFIRGATVAGPAHHAAGEENQDALLIRSERPLWCVAVSDGMGSKPYAQIGSRAACRAAWNAVRAEPLSADNKTVISSLYRNWIQQLEGIGIPPGDAAATCLIAWGSADGRFRLLQLGDGLILGHNLPETGLCSRPEQDFGNETTALGVSRRYSDWNCLSGSLRADEGLLLMTDGVSEDLASSVGLVSATIKSVRGLGVRAAKMRLRRELEAWPTPLHRDDKTVAVVYRA